MKLARIVTEVTLSSPDDAEMHSPLYESPDAYELGQNFPNPFNPVRMINFAMPQSAHVRIDAFNVKGELVKMLVNGAREAGYHTVEWNAAGEASGIYFYRIVTGEFTMTRKMLLLR